MPYDLPSRCEQSVQRGCRRRGAATGNIFCSGEQITERDATTCHVKRPPSSAPGGSVGADGTAAAVRRE